MAAVSYLHVKKLLCIFQIFRPTDLAFVGALTSTMGVSHDQGHVTQTGKGLLTSQFRAGFVRFMFNASFIFGGRIPIESFLER